MVVCHCEMLNDTSIREHLEQTASIDELAERCGAGSQCGGCLDTIRDLVERFADMV